MGIRTINRDVRRAVFLDRDGVLNRPIIRNGRPHPPATIEEFDVLPGVREALCDLSQLGFWLVVITNQPDVARGTQQRETVEAMHAILRRTLPLVQFYVCYHDDADSCDCRKPKPGLLFAAATEHKLFLPESYMIGDRWRDVDCGYAANCTTIFIDNGYTESLGRQPHFRVPDLSGAAAVISSLEGVLPV